MTARDRFLSELAEQRRDRENGERDTLPKPKRAIQTRCRRCHRPRGWLCEEYGRPCIRRQKKREQKPTTKARKSSGYRAVHRERLRQFYLRKYGVAA